MDKNKSSPMSHSLLFLYFCSDLRLTFYCTILPCMTYPSWPLRITRSILTVGHREIFYTSKSHDFLSNFDTTDSILVPRTYQAISPTTMSPEFLRYPKIPCISITHSIIELPRMVCTWLREMSSCSYLPDLVGHALVLLS